MRAKKKEEEGTICVIVKREKTVSYFDIFILADGNERREVKKENCHTCPKSS